MATVKTRLSTTAQQGFSLLEAIVALVILASTCMAMFAWIGGSLTQLQRAELYADASPAIASASNYLKTTDLAKQPKGTFSSGGILVDWAATAIETDSTRSPSYGNSNFLVSLYNVTLTARNGSRSLPALQTRIINYRLKPDLPDPRDGL